MRGHAGANVVPVIASNRVGREIGKIAITSISSDAPSSPISLAMWLPKRLDRTRPS